MLDSTYRPTAITPDGRRYFIRSFTPPQDDLLAAVKRWRPDPVCLAVMRRHLEDAARSGAAAGLSDRQITAEFCEYIGVNTATTPEDVYAVIADYCSWGGLLFENIVAILCHLATEVPLWPCDEDLITDIATAAIERYRS